MAGTHAPQGGGEATVHEVKQIDLQNNTFDGKKADLFINTGRLGREYLVTVKGEGGKPMLIAIHL